MGEMVELTAGDSSLKIYKKIGITPYSWIWRDTEILFSPPLDIIQQKNRLFGIPIMYPFANRLVPATMNYEGIDTEDVRWLKDTHQQIMHGLLLWKDCWIYNDTASSPTKAVFTLHWGKDLEFFKYFPITHQIEISYILNENSLIVSVQINNLDIVELPISYGFHPYFLIDRTDDDNAQIKIPASLFYETDDLLLPNGKLNTTAALFNPTQFSALSEVFLDTCFCDLIGNEKNQFIVDLKTKNYHLKMIMDQQYKNAIVYLPKDKQKPYICIEPMIASTNAWHQKYDQLSKILPNQKHISTFEMILEK